MKAFSLTEWTLWLTLGSIMLWGGSIIVVCILTIWIEEKWMYQKYVVNYDGLLTLSVCVLLVWYDIRLHVTVVQSHLQLLLQIIAKHDIGIRTAPTLSTIAFTTTHLSRIPKTCFLEEHLDLCLMLDSFPWCNHEQQQTSWFNVLEGVVYSLKRKREGIILRTINHIHYTNTSLSEASA